MTASLSAPLRQPTTFAGLARSLTAQLDEGVERSFDVLNVPKSTVNAFLDSGLSWMIVPACLGGGEADVREYFEVIETLSHLDGATGWTFMANANSVGMIGAFLPDAAVEKIFSDPRALAAGQIAPSGTAVRTEGGLKVEGRFGFASGSEHAGWILGGYREISDGEPVRLPNGLPNVLAAVHPRSSVEFLGNWNVIGLQATGSVDYRIPEQVISESFTWPLFTSKPLRGGPFYQIGVNGMTCINHGAFSVGVARRALDEIAVLAVSKRRAGRQRLVDDPVFQSEYAAAEARLSAARAFAIEALVQLEEAAASGEVSLYQRARARLATTHASRCCVEVAEFAYRYSGSTGLRNGSTIQQCFRDLTASEAHFFTDHNSMKDAGTAILGVAPPSLFI